MSHNNDYPYQFGNWRYQDVIIRYTPEEFSRHMSRSLGILRPELLRQFIYQAPVPTEPFLLTVNSMLESQCSEFATHSLRWEYPMHNPDILTRMIHYNSAWEGFASDEPWSNCRRQRIHYFFDTEYALRLQEMENNF